MTVAALNIIVLAMFVNNKQICVFDGVNVEIVKVRDRLIHLNLKPKTKNSANTIHVLQPMIENSKVNWHQISTNSQYTLKYKY